MSVLSIEHLCYSYTSGAAPVLQDINLEFEKGAVYAITGNPGAGKTTLLSIIAGLDKAWDGRVLYNGADISELDREKYRSHSIGAVFRNLNLLPGLTALENVELSMDISGTKTENRREHALRTLSRVGLDETAANRRAAHLSGGEQQRAAIARAISYNPNVIIADEPTENLDAETENAVMGLLKELAHNDGKCVIVATCSPGVADQADVVYKI